MARIVHHPRQGAVDRKGARTGPYGWREVPARDVVNMFTIARGPALLARRPPRPQRLTSAGRIERPPWGRHG